MTIVIEKVVHKIINKGGMRIILPSYVAQGTKNMSIPTDLYAQSSDPLYPLGTILEDDERRFRYAHIKNTTGSAYRGRALLDWDDPAELGAYLGAQTAGATTFTWTSVAAITENAYSGGSVLLQGGFVRKIKANTVATGASEVVTFTLEDGETIPETAAASRYAMLKKNKWANLISRSIATGQKAGHCVGVSTFDMTHNYYGFVQSKGLCGVIATPATLGDAMNDMAMVMNQAGAEVSIEAGHGYQVIGHCVFFDQIDWDNENFILIDLCIE